ncbi:YtpI family protein [Cohnella panacarvi]|uniref:YtpI family protein n=1 Tax=Cohnella panacarvi TaxID=400776 RepID=UPI00047A52D3|nr:YtpI family protein [Cohnella panacarvi]
MVFAIQLALTVLVIVTCCLSVYFSFKSRKSADVKQRGLYAARLNINMGLMLVFISILLMVLFSGSSVRVVVSSLFFLLGIFNLFAGMKNHSHYTRLMQQQSR